MPFISAAGTRKKGARTILAMMTFLLPKWSAIRPPITGEMVPMVLIQNNTVPISTMLPPLAAIRRGRKKRIPSKEVSLHRHNSHKGNIDLKVLLKDRRKPFVEGVSGSASALSVGMKRITRKAPAITGTSVASGRSRPVPNNPVMNMA